MVTQAYRVARVLVAAWFAAGVPGALATTPDLLADLYPGTGASAPSAFVSMGNRCFFAAIGYSNGANVGRELWVTDGTTEGTHLVRDINPGTASASPDKMVVVGDTLFFVADDGTHGIELWRSDGTPEGTVLVRDIRAGSPASSLDKLTAVGGTLYFVANDGVNGLELWKSDGTAEGTVLVKDLCAGAASAFFSALVALGDTLFLSAYDGVHGFELWVSDGTPEGTRIIDIQPGSGSSGPSYLTAWHGAVYFRAAGSGADYELWKSDGTADGTVRVCDINAGTAGSSPTYLLAADQALFFRANDAVHGNELWKSDGTTAGTVLVKDIASGTASSDPTVYTAWGGAVYLAANDGTHGTEVWRSDGTATGTALLRDIYSGTVGSMPGQFASADGLLYFTANDGDPVSSVTVWQTDGTAGGTLRLRDLHPGTLFSSPSYLTWAGGLLLFRATASGFGYEPWVFDTTIYVDADAVGGNDGTSWGDAYTDLSSALSTAVTGDRVWVAEGTYRPTATTNRSASFVLKNGVPVVGGFGGTERAMGDEPDPAMYRTILSGDIGVPGDSSDNSYVVVRAASALLHGFTITGANGTGFGGGLYSQYVSPTIRRCVFAGNRARYGGGAVIQGQQGSVPPRIENCRFVGNQADVYGGGLFVYSSQPTVENCLFHGNSASQRGGGLCLFAYSTALVNGCTIMANSAGSGGGLYSINSTGALRNSIVWANSASSYPQAQSVPASLVFRCCDVQGSGGSAAWDSLLGTDAGGNVDANPQFVDPDGQDRVPGTADDDVRLATGSPCIDAGDDSVVTTATDLDGNPRVHDDPGTPNGSAGAVDLGVYEYRAPILLPLTVVATVPPAGATLVASDLNLEVTFSDGVTGVDPSDIVLSGSGAASASVLAVTDRGGSVWRFHVTGLVDGPVAVALAPDAGDIVDSHGQGPSPQPTVWAYTVSLTPGADVVYPTVSSVTVTAVTTIAVTFSEAVGEGALVAGNYVFSGSGAGTLAANPSAVIGLDSRTVGLECTGEMLSGGDLTVTVDGVRDLAGNPLGWPNAATAVGGGQGIPPVALLSSTAAEPTIDWPIPVTLTFSEAVSEIAESDLVPSANAAILNYVRTASGCTFDLAPRETGVVVSVAVQAGAVQDAAGNENALAVLTRTFQGYVPVWPVLDLAEDDPNVLVYGGRDGDRLTYSGGLAAGDVNGDGIKDLVIVASFADKQGTRTDCGEVYVYFGGPGAAGVKDIAGLVGTPPDVVIYGAAAYDTLGKEGLVAVADVNGDGTDDLLIGVPFAAGPDGRSQTGELHIIYGGPSIGGVVDLAAWPGDVLIYGAAAGDYLGRDRGSVRVGDLNGDGHPDLVVGTAQSDGPSGQYRSNAGACYVFSGEVALPAVVDLATAVPGEPGFPVTTVHGAAASSYLTSDGSMDLLDLNADGFLDLAVTGRLANQAGAVYVLYGGPQAFAGAVLDLAEGIQDLTVDGTVDIQAGGPWALAAGDLNGDGMADLIMGNAFADGPGDSRVRAGEVYVVYGGADVAGTIHIADGDQDITIYGSTSDGELSSYRALVTGDVNGDGVDDLMVGAYGRSCVHLVEGSASLPAVIDLAADAGVCTVFGVQAGVGYRMGVCDLNGDGTGDLLVGAPMSGPQMRPSAGAVVVVYGSDSLPTDVWIPAGEADVSVYGGYAGCDVGSSVCSADIDNDGIDDLFAGTTAADGPGRGRYDCGEVYSIFGRPTTDSATVKRYHHAGNPLPTEFGSARAVADYSSGDASATTVTLLRSSGGDVLPGLDRVARVQWAIDTDRVDVANLVFHYLDSEIAGLEEARLAVFGSVAGGELVLLPSVLDAARNRVAVSAATSCRLFVLAEMPAPGVPDLLPESDTGVSDGDDITRLDNSAPEGVLRFQVADTMPGTVVTVYANGTPVGEAVATGPVTVVATTGNCDIADGTCAVTATQREPCKAESEASHPLPVTIDTTDPVLTLGGGASMPEGQTFTRVGSFADPDGTSWTVGVDYGDGSGGDLLLSSDKTFQVEHFYGDDGLYTIAVVVTDAAGNSGSDAVILTVYNVAPAAEADNAALIADEGQTVCNSGTFSDPGDDTVTLTASVGVIVQEGTESGAWSWSYTPDDGPDDSQTVIITATDSDGAASATTFALTVNNVAPLVAADRDTVAVDEGDTATSTGTYRDPGDDTVALSASAGTVTANLDGTWTWTLCTADGPADSQTVVITAVDSDHESTTTTFELIVANVAPAIGPIVAPIDPTPVNTEITVSAPFIDPGISDEHMAAWDWGDGTTSVGSVAEDPADPTSGLVTGSHTYTGPGVYTVMLVIDDGDEGWDDEVFMYVVVYDAADGFVTGGGWIDSPAGAFAYDPSVAGKVAFGFAAKYEPGASVPTGQTQLSFRVADLTFHSTDYQWLVIAGTQAKYRGTGAINGDGGYGFVLTAIDGQQAEGDGVDRFRIRIWDMVTGETIYDTQMGAPDDAADATALGGGSIVIHEP